MSLDQTPTPTSETSAATPTADATPVVTATETPAAAPVAAPAPGTEGQTALGGATATTEGEKPAGEAEAAAAVVPEAYELAMPEGIPLDAAALETATPVFKELGLTNEQANKLVPVAMKYAESIAKGVNDQVQTQIAAERKSWLDTAKADPEIGGPNWDKTMSGAAAALDRFGFKEGSPFRQLLNDSGLGNHPDMIRAWSRVNAATGEGSFVRGDGSAAVPKTDAEIFYGKK